MFRYSGLTVILLLVGAAAIDCVLWDRSDRPGRRTPTARSW
jgi:hypothetical protein